MYLFTSTFVPCPFCPSEEQVLLRTQDQLSKISSSLMTLAYDPSRVPIDLDTAEEKEQEDKQEEEYSDSMLY